MAESQQSFEGQHEGESVHYVFRRHPIVLRRTLIYFLLIITLGLVPMLFWPLDATPRFVALGALVIAILQFIYFWIGWYYSVYILTDERFIQIKQKGLFDRRVVEIGLDKIQNVNFEIKGVQETVLHYGTLVIQTYVGDLILPNIYHAERVQRQLNERIRLVQGSGPLQPPQGESNA